MPKTQRANADFLTHRPFGCSSYFIPEDGDDETYPNVFLAAKSRHPGVPPSLAQIRDAFPLPGRYHFRFKSPLVPGGDRDKDAMAVWMDCVQENAPVPTWRNSIVAKVTRTGVEDDEEDDEDFVSGGATHTPSLHHAHSAPPRTASAPAPPQPAAQPQPARTQHQAPSLDIFDQPAASSMPTSAPPSTGNLLDGHHHPAPAPASGGLLDMDAPVYGNHGSSNNAHSDFLGMTAPVAMHQPHAGGYNPPAGNPYAQQQRQQQNAFANFSDQQGPFGGLGTPWK